MRKVISYFIFIVLAVCIFSCKSDKADLQPVKTSAMDEFVRNPITLEGPIDSSQTAKIEFTERSYDFGTIDEGEIITRIFHFTNTGKRPLIISEAKSTCGCTIPEYSKEPIAVGGKGEIQVRFNSENKSGHQDKPITIYSNTLPSRTVLRMRGDVIQKNNK